MTLAELRTALAGSEATLDVSRAGRLVATFALGGRRQAVRARLAGDWLRLESRVLEARRALEDGRSVRSLAWNLLGRNRELEFVALARVDGWIVGRVDLPSDVPVGEAVAQAHRLARYCDWWEAVLTGEDAL